MNHNVESLVNPFAAHQQLLYERLRFFLNDIPAPLQDDVIRALQEPGKLLAAFKSKNLNVDESSPNGIWSLLTYLIAQYINPAVSPLKSGTTAIAVECLICALDLLDDVEDEDKTAILLEIGAPRALNVSTLLLGLAHRALLSLTKELQSSSDIFYLVDALDEAIITATAGQHKDLSAEQRSPLDMTQEECIEIAASKAGSLMRLACLLGALCADADDHVCEMFAELGRLAGIAAQLDNDSHDLYYLLQSTESASPPTSDNQMTDPRSLKTDIVRNKKTLPVVIAARTQVDIQSQSAFTIEEQQDIFRRTLHEGIIATWGISLLYRTRARESLQKIEAQYSVSPLLRTLLGLQ